MSAERRAPAVFVTGTDTGVGKSVVTAALARHFSSTGLRVGVMKPCETGVDDPSRPGADAALLRWAAGSTDEDELVAPYRFEEPLAPALAAERKGTIIDAGHIAEAFAAVARGKDLVLVEGAGGLMVPLRGGFLIADLAAMLATPLLIVARPGLGTLNHTLLTVFAARAMELTVAGIVVNRMPAAPDTAEREAPHLLAALASADLLAVLPEVAATEHERVDRLAALIATLPTRFWLTRALGLN